MEIRITDDIHILHRVLPMPISYALEEIGNTNDLLEVVMDLGRLPLARYTTGEITLSDREVERAELDLMTSRIGSFDADNRAGMERTLHRISAIRNRRGEIVGLTVRIGRAVYGTIDIIEELIMSGQSVLMLGAPGVGKTTMLREVARVLAEKKRVVIVDTSNEIGGDGDVPHPAVGKARRMQVSHPDRQHEVMIEAVENHNPQVIIIDEIGRELEAQAARTIAERGVQLIGTAHGNTLENLLLNPTLSDLVGGIETVTISDEEARRRGTQKSILERKSPPTFTVLVEIQSRDRMAVHEDVALSVDLMLRGRSVTIDLRTRMADGRIQRERQAVAPDGRVGRNSDTERMSGRGQRGQREERGNNGGVPPNTKMVRGNNHVSDEEEGGDELQILLTPRQGLQELIIYAYGVARNRLVQSARRLRVPLTVTDDFEQAQAVITMKTYYRNRPKQIADAERRGMPIYVLRASTVSQIENFLIDVFKLEQREHVPQPDWTSYDEDDDDMGDGL